MDTERLKEAEIKEGLKERLIEIVGDKPPFTWARDVGIGKSTFDGIWNKGARPQLRTLLKIACNTNVSLSWLLTGKGTSRLQEIPVSLPINQAHITVPYVSEPSEEYRLQNESYILVPRFNLYDENGVRKKIHSNQLVDHLAFKAVWITKDMGLDPRELVLLTVQGDSMAPTLNEGDMLLLDKREREVRNDGIYALLGDNSLIVKRLQRGFDGSVIVKSDNQAYETQIIQPQQRDSLLILGRVVWTGQRL